MKRRRGDTGIDVPVVHHLIGSTLTAQRKAASLFLSVFHGEDAGKDAYTETDATSTVRLTIEQSEKRAFAELVERESSKVDITVSVKPGAPYPVQLLIGERGNYTTPAGNFAEIVENSDKLNKDMVRVVGGTIVAMEAQNHVATLVRCEDGGVIISVCREPDMSINLSMVHAFAGPVRVSFRVTVKTDVFEFRPSFIRFVE